MNDHFWRIKLFTKNVSMAKKATKQNKTKQNKTKKTTKNQSKSLKKAQKTVENIWQNKQTTRY